MYNAEKYIERCLESIFNQGLDPEKYEVIVMNDGSTDHCPQLVQNYLDKGYPVAIYTHKNIGADGSKNKGFKHVKGKFTYLIDADDYLAHNCFDTLLQRGIEDNLDIVAFGAHFTGEEANFKVDKNPKDIVPPRIISGKKFLEEHRDVRFEAWWFMVKTAFLEETGVRFQADNACSDTYYTLEHFLQAERIAYYPIEIYRYYEAPTSLTRDKTDSAYVSRMQNDFRKTSLGFSDILLRLKKQDTAISPQLWDNLTHRRDFFVFYCLSLMIKDNCSKQQINEHIEFLKQKDAYPIKNFIGPEYSSLKWKLFNFIFNQKSFLLKLAPIYRKLN